MQDCSCAFYPSHPLCSQFFIAGTKAFHPGGETPSTSSMARMTSVTSMVVHIELRIALHQHRQRDAMRGVGNFNATLLPLGVFSWAKYLCTLACAALYALLLYFIWSSGFGDWCTISQSTQAHQLHRCGAVGVSTLQHVGLLHLQPCTRYLSWQNQCSACTYALHKSSTATLSSVERRVLWRGTD